MARNRCDYKAEAGLARLHISQQDALMVAIGIQHPVLTPVQD